MSHHIEHIEITNFKSIRHATIEGCKRINVFIGYPNVGKSAILEAMSALSYFIQEYDAPFSTICRVKFANELFHNANIKQDAIIDIGQAKVSFTHLNEIEFDLKVDLLNRVTTTNPKQWDQLRKIQYKKDDNRKSFISTVTHNNHFATAKGRVSIETLCPVKKYAFKGDFNENRSDIKSLRSPHGENLVDIVQFNKEVRKEVGELFKSYGIKLLIDQATNSIRGLKQLDEETIFSIPFYQMADTLQRLIFHKAAIMSNENSVLLFEEPEAHMFPPYIRKFTKDIVFDKERNNQFFIATHSPLVVSDFLEDAREDLAIHLVGLKNGETTIKTLTEAEITEVYEYGVDLFFNIESYLE